MALLPLPAPLQMGVGTIVALLPIVLALYWLVPVPRIWDIHPSWVVMASLLTSALLVLFGRYFAGLMLSGLFREAPSQFPIAQTVATYFGAALGAIAIICALAFVVQLASV